MAAMAGASGVRGWMQSRGWTFLSPRRLRRLTVALFVVATAVSTIGLSGSTRPAGAAAAPSHVHAHAMP
jgi:hypothetical protein